MQKNGMMGLNERGKRKERETEREREKERERDYLELF